MYDIISEQYGEDNIIGLYTHYDEKHTYIDAETGKERTSRDHMHVYVIREIDGKLNGKKFSSKRNMTKLNNSIQKMTQADYGIDFMNGTKRKSKDSVETLKRRSEERAIEQREAELEAERQKLKGLQKEYETKIQNIDERTKRAVQYYDDAMKKRRNRADRIAPSEYESKFGITYGE